MSVPTLVRDRTGLHSACIRTPVLCFIRSASKYDARSIYAWVLVLLLFVSYHRCTAVLLWLYRSPCPAPVLSTHEFHCLAWCFTWCSISYLSITPATPGLPHLLTLLYIQGSRMGVSMFHSCTPLRYELLGLGTKILGGTRNTFHARS